MRIAPEFTLPEKIIFVQTTFPAFYEKSDVRLIGFLGGKGCLAEH